MTLESCWQCGAPPTEATTATASTKSQPLLDLSHLLASNDTPLDSEISFICDVISDGKGLVNALSSQIDNLEAVVARLIRKRDEMAQLVCQHRAILSPVRRVPPELVCDILALSLSSNDDDTEIRPPWHLGHICGSWRRAVLGYPALWSFIIVPSYFPSDRRPPLPMIETQLIRSADVPLSVCWSSHRDGDLPGLHALDLVVSHSHRWRRLLLHISHPNVWLDWLRAAGGRLAALETFELGGHYTRIPDILSTAPSLCKVFLTDRNFGASPPAPAIPWGQITHYAGSFTEDSQVEIVRRAPNLVSCAIGFPDWVDSFAPGEPVVLPRLRRLRIEMAGFLPRLQAPLLQELFCSCSTMLHGQSEILPFVERSACSLQTLSLIHCSINFDLIAVLRGLKSLTHLIIEDQDKSDDDSPQITLFDDLAGDLCPNLTSLAYGFASAFSRSSRSHFFAMAQSRFQHETPGLRFTRLRLFRSRYYSPGEACPPSIAVAIQNICDDGFDAGFVEPNEFEGKHFFS
ncbi:hypothetical protein B0H14DRAFT_2775049 [Mycena olivaceomarginata]|nr:hypothetical protein B0H14DRAFT_2775049 [Mycena olivaceomarginata]